MPSALKIPFLPTPGTLFAAISDPLLSLLYPRPCGTCSGSVERHELGGSCDECWKASRIFRGDETLCGKCGAFLSDSPSQIVPNCGQCTSHEYDGARALGVYEHAVRTLVIGLKSTPYLSPRSKAELAAAFQRAGFPHDSVVVPVPLSKKRAIERGYNQAAVIGEFVASTAAMVFDEDSLARSVDTPLHRIGMDSKARELTVKNSFVVTRPRAIAGRPVVLVDDVFTSGATASACAKVLKKNGATGVFVFTLARAVRFS